MGVAKYRIGAEEFTMNELREGYAVLSGLDNGGDFSDEEMLEYMREALFEEDC